MPIQARLTAVVTAGPRPLADDLAGLGSGAHGTTGAPGVPGAPGPIVVPVQGADTAGIDSFLGAPEADVIARREAAVGRRVAPARPWSPPPCSTSPRRRRTPSSWACCSAPTGGRRSGRGRPR